MVRQSATRIPKNRRYSIVWKIGATRLFCKRLKNNKIDQWHDSDVVLCILKKFIPLGVLVCFLMMCLPNRGLGGSCSRLFHFKNGINMMIFNSEMGKRKTESSVWGHIAVALLIISFTGFLLMWLL